MDPLDVRVLRGVNGRTADPVEFGARAHIDQANGRIELQKFESLRGQNGARVGQLVLSGALPWPGRTTARACSWTRSPIGHFNQAF